MLSENYFVRQKLVTYSEFSRKLCYINTLKCKARKKSFIATKKFYCIFDFYYQIFIESLSQFHLWEEGCIEGDC